MGAAQDEGVDPRGTQRLQILPGHRLDDRITGAEAPVLHQRHKQRAGLDIHLNGAVQRRQTALIGPGAHGCRRGDQAHPLISGRRGGRRAGGLHHTENGDIVLGRQHRQSVGRYGAAGHQQRFHIKAPQEMYILPGVAQQYFRRAPAVGDTGRVAEVYNVLRGEDAAYLPHGGQSAGAGVEHPDRPLIHMRPPFSCRRGGSA